MALLFFVCAVTVSIPVRCERGGWHKKQLRATEPLPDCFFCHARAAKGIHGFHLTYLDSVTFTIFTGQFGPCRWVENEFCSYFFLFKKLFKDDDYCKILVLDFCSLFYPRWVRCSIFFHGALLVHCCTVQFECEFAVVPCGCAKILLPVLPQLYAKILYGVEWNMVFNAE